MTDSQNLDPLLGKVLEGRYSVDELIARGGMATVYRGTDLRLGRTVALKVLGGVLVNDPDFVDRFTQEARATAALTHPNVVAVHDQGISEGFPFLVMEFVQGRTIREIMAQSGPFTSAHALEIISSVLAGLSSAHDAGFVHRDIKPENVLITHDGHIKVTDFGLARVINDTPVSDSTGAVLLGTMAYLSPEQVQQLAVDQRSDVYSCGILLYEMVTGLVPFTGSSPLEVAYQHVNSSVSAPSSIQPDVPPAVDHLVLAATRKSPTERIQSAREFRDGVVRAISAVPRAEALTTALPLQNTQVIPTPVRGAHRATGAVPLQKPNPGVGPSGVHRESSTKPKGRKWAPLLLILALLVGGGTWYQFTGSYEVVPPVSSLTVDEATVILAPLELGVEVVEEFSEDIPAGVVIRTDPASGENARKGTPVTLIVSKGQERYLIPSDLTGQDPKDATSALEALTLVVSATNEVFDEVIPVGKVVSTDPIGGTSVKRETPVTILVSKGPAPVEVPPIIGTLITDATTTLGAIGLTTETTREDFDDSVAGTILSTDPIPGTTVPKGTIIKVVLSKGPVLVDVPNVVGMDVATATTTLQGAGFQVKTVNKLTVAILNKVYSQNPAAGSKAPKGSVITLEIV
ncbi:MAG: Stk1 family PASTA domain-containing Ser/Thr kinase [Actinobacteria bacterium]|nr:Stk1 family PASTA domain-containing Ser/Thr kinase [Actinomycetota bacterium]